jgi:hypothetical protein
MAARKLYLCFGTVPDICRCLPGSISASMTAAGCSSTVSRAFLICSAMRTAARASRFWKLGRCGALPFWHLSYSVNAAPVALFPLRRPQRGRKPTCAITIERRFRLNGASLTAARAVVELASFWPMRWDAFDRHHR